MRFINLNILTVALAAVSLFFMGCQDDISTIGSQLSQSELTIYPDTLDFSLRGQSKYVKMRDTKSAYTLLGRISTKEYGTLSCSYVTQFLPASSLNIPDTITPEHVDSVKMYLSIPSSQITGNTESPQQVKVYNLIKELPSDINASFDPTGYYEEPYFGKGNYNLSAYVPGDTTYSKISTLNIGINLPVEFGKRIFNAYKENPSLFQWPDEFNKLWPGVFVAPSFGSGCIAPVLSTRVFAYFPKSSSYTDEEGNVAWKQVADSVCLFSTAPEVISNVNIDYTPSPLLESMASGSEDGKCIITTPGGYEVDFTFPAKEILEKYINQDYDMGVINNLLLSIPAKKIANDFGIDVPTSLLMIKSSQKETFFSEGKVPDGRSSFVGNFSQSNGSYSFASMRDYIIDLLNKGVDNIEKEDVTFTLIPVEITTEDSTNTSTGEVVNIVTSVYPYMVKPTMVELQMDKPQIIFVYSTQSL